MVITTTTISILNITITTTVLFHGSYHHPLALPSLLHGERKKENERDKDKEKGAGEIFYLLVNSFKSL